MFVSMHVCVVYGVCDVCMMDVCMGIVINHLYNAELRYHTYTYTHTYH